MRTYEEIAAGARPGPAFSNGTQWEAWSSNWCERCIHYGDPDAAGFDGGCPLVRVAIVERTVPTEWHAETPEAEIFADYACIEFRDEDSGPGPEPQPVPDPPGQETLWPREPFEGTRMLVPLDDAQPVTVSA